MADSDSILQTDQIELDEKEGELQQLLQNLQQEQQKEEEDFLSSPPHPSDDGDDDDDDDDDDNFEDFYKSSKMVLSNSNKSKKEKISEKFLENFLKLLHKQHPYYFERFETKQFTQFLRNVFLSFLYTIIHTIKNRYFILSMMILMIKIDGFTLIFIFVYVFLDVVLTFLMVNYFFHYLIKWIFQKRGRKPSKPSYYTPFEFILNIESLYETKGYKIFQLFILVGSLLGCIVLSFFDFFALPHINSLSSLLGSGSEREISCYDIADVNGTNPHQYWIFQLPFINIYHFSNTSINYKNCEVTNWAFFEFYKGLVIGLISIGLFLYGKMSYDGPASLRYVKQLQTLRKNSIPFPRIKLGYMKMITKSSTQILNDILNNLHYLKQYSHVHPGERFNYSLIKEDSTISHLDFSYFEYLTPLEVGFLEFFFIDYHEKDENFVKLGIPNVNYVNGMMCDHCKGTFSEINPYYHCKKCTNYDLCYHCYHKRIEKGQHTGHVHKLQLYSGLPDLQLDVNCTHCRKRIIFDKESSVASLVLYDESTNTTLCTDCFTVERQNNNFFGYDLFLSKERLREYTSRLPNKQIVYHYFCGDCDKSFQIIKPFYHNSEKDETYCIDCAKKREDFNEKLQINIGIPQHKLTYFFKTKNSVTCSECETKHLTRFFVFENDKEKFICENCFQKKNEVDLNSRIFRFIDIKENEYDNRVDNYAMYDERFHFHIHRVMKNLLKNEFYKDSKIIKLFKDRHDRYFFQNFLDTVLFFILFVIFFFPFEILEKVFNNGCAMTTGSLILIIVMFVAGFPFTIPIFCLALNTDFFDRKQNWSIFCWVLCLCFCCILPHETAFLLYIFALFGVYYLFNQYIFPINGDSQILSFLTYELCCCPCLCCIFCLKSFGKFCYVFLLIFIFFISFLIYIAIIFGLFLLFNDSIYNMIRFFFFDTSFFEKTTGLLKVDGSQIDGSYLYKLFAFRKLSIEVVLLRLVNNYVVLFVFLLVFGFFYWISIHPFRYKKSKFKRLSKWFKKIQIGQRKDETSKKPLKFENDSSFLNRIRKQCFYRLFCCCGVTFIISVVTVIFSPIILLFFPLLVVVFPFLLMYNVLQNKQNYFTHKQIDMVENFHKEVDEMKKMIEKVSVKSNLLLGKKEEIKKQVKIESWKNREVRLMSLKELKLKMKIFNFYTFLHKSSRTLLSYLPKQSTIFALDHTDLIKDNEKSKVLEFIESAYSDLKRFENDQFLMGKEICKQIFDNLKLEPSKIEFWAKQISQQFDGEGKKGKKEGKKKKKSKFGVISDLNKKLMSTVTKKSDLGDAKVNETETIDIEFKNFLDIRSMEKKICGVTVSISYFKKYGKFGRPAINIYPRKCYKQLLEVSYRLEIPGTDFSIETGEIPYMYGYGWFIEDLHLPKDIDKVREFTLRVSMTISKIYYDIAEEIYSVFYYGKDETDENVNSETKTIEIHSKGRKNVIMKTFTLIDVPFWLEFYPLGTGTNDSYEKCVIYLYHKLFYTHTVSGSYSFKVEDDYGNVHESTTDESQSLKISYSDICESNLETNFKVTVTFKKIDVTNTPTIAEPSE